MPRYLVYSLASGAAVSEGTVVADPLPDGLAVTEVPETPGWTWDPDARAVVARVAPLREWCSVGDFYARLGPLHTLANRLRLDVSTPLEVRAELESLSQVLASVARVELNDPRTQYGVAALVSLAAQAGVIPDTPEARAAETARILAPFPA